MCRMTTDRARLRTKVLETVVPDLEKNGFVQHFNDDHKVREIRVAYPFGDFQRINGREMQAIAINFGKYHHLGFFLEAGLIPPGGVAAAGVPTNMIRQSDCTAQWGSPAFRIKPTSWRISKFFKMRPGAKDKEVEDLVDLARERIQEAFVWFDTGEVGKHMRRIN